VEVPVAVPAVVAAEEGVVVAVVNQTDRFGLGWRPQLAVGILANLHRIDVVEVIADDYFRASRNERRALQTLASQIGVTLHGVTLGLASTVLCDTRRLDQMARLVNTVEPVFWSEHLAFVRGGGIEIGHLAAPPRCSATVDGALRNLKLARDVVGLAPQVENVATLIDPPGSDRDELTWVREIVTNSNTSLLLDLHNLYANGLNFSFDPLDFIAHIPGNLIGSVHLAGGKWIGNSAERRLLDDHRHDVPLSVYELLEEVGARTSHPLTVVLERDGEFPSIECLMDQIDFARQALARGRARRNLVQEEAA
jgi:uncharacterized protein